MGRSEVHFRPLQPFGPLLPWFFQGFPEEKEPIRSRTPRQDFCNKYRFAVPVKLAPGAYKLIVKVTDKTRPEQPREATQTLEFRVTSLSARLS